MVCFWLGCNHISYGMVKIKPSRRLSLELVSLVLILITWCFTIPGIIMYSNTGVGRLKPQEVINIFTTIVDMITGRDDGSHLSFQLWGRDENNEIYVINIFKAIGHDIFAANCAIYTIISAFFLVLNLFYRKEYLKLGQKPLPLGSEWVARNKRDNCCTIFSPCNALRMFHHLEHRAGFIVNIVCATFGVELYFTIPLILLTFTQIIISYLYAEDIVLCTFPLCCVQLFFIRRYPQEEFGDKDKKMEEVLSV